MEYILIEYKRRHSTDKVVLIVRGMPPMSLGQQGQNLQSGATAADEQRRVRLRAEQEEFEVARCPSAVPAHVPAECGFEGGLLEVQGEPEAGELDAGIGEDQGDERAVQPDSGRLPEVVAGRAVRPGLRGASAGPVGSEQAAEGRREGRTAELRAAGQAEAGAEVLHARRGRGWGEHVLDQQAQLERRRVDRVPGQGVRHHALQRLPPRRS